MSNRSLLVGLGLVLLLALPWLLGWSFFAQESRYAVLRKRYGCSPGGTCAGDFDGDGRNGYVNITPFVSAAHSERWLIVSDAGREILRLPYAFIDDSLRTHVAVRDDTMPARLLIFDHSSQVYVMAEPTLAPTAPDALDQEILAALAARDDRGTFLDRILLRYAIIFGGAAYDLIVICVAVAVFFVRRRHLRDE